MEADPEIMCGIMGNIGQFRLKDQFIDLQINIDDYQFRCHRIILCACSELFQVLLQSERKVEHPVKEVTVRGVSPAMFQLALNAIYKGENGLDTENMMEFWHAARELQIPVLIAKCEAFINSHMTRENILGIYTRALLLGSEKIIKRVHDFMAENFEYFSKCQVFMLLPAKTLQKILSSKHLKVDTQNDLVDLILKWNGYEPCGNEVGKSYAGDILEVQNTNIVSDPLLDHSTSGINDKTLDLEVILQKSPVASENSCLQTMAQLLTETPASRKESLGELLKLVRLSEASRDCLEILADSDMIMGVKETRDIVRQALKAHIQVLEPLKDTVLSTSSDSLADLFAKTEQVVIFGQGNTIYAYSLDRSGFFYYRLCSNLLSICAFNNYIFVTERFPSEMKMTTYKFANSAENGIEFRGVGYCSAMIGDFCYTFRDNGLFRTCYDPPYVWLKLIEFKWRIKCDLINIFKGNLLFYDSEANDGSIYCFSTETHTVSSIMKLTMVHKVVSFIHNDQLYVLTHDGYIRNITANVGPTFSHSDADMEGGSLQQMFVSDDDTNACEEIKRVNVKTSDATRNPVGAHAPQKLWEGSHELCGAVVYTGKLVIFANLNYCKASVITDKSVIPVPGLSEINFIHLPAANKCYPMIVPSGKLIRKA